MLNIVPCSLDEANKFVKQHHRHHQPVVGYKFAVGVANADDVCGVAIVGRPSSRILDNGWTLEVTRCCTDGTKNACSMLYATCWRAARAMGYKRLITYILDTESGVSLIATGWRLVGEAGGGTWNRRSRPRVDKHPTQRKLLFEAASAAGG